MARVVSPSEAGRRALEEGIAAALRELREQGFILEWGRQGSRWTVVVGADEFGPYTTREAYGFVDGCRAMGAGE